MPNVYLFCTIDLKHQTVFHFTHQYIYIYIIYMIHLVYVLYPHRPLRVLIGLAVIFTSASSDSAQGSI